MGISSSFVEEENRTILREKSPKVGKEVTEVFVAIRHGKKYQLNGAKSVRASNR
jgi:hypothetical protein